MQQSSRRAFLGSVGVAGIGVSAYISPGRTGAAEDLDAAVPSGQWPMQGRTPQRSGYQPESAGPPEEHEMVWERDVYDLLGIFHEGTTVATEDTLAITGPTALSTADGSTRWAEPLTTESIGLTRVCWNETLYVADGERVYAIDTDSGTIEWAHRESRIEVAFVAGRTVICRGQRRGTVGLDAKTGATRWRVSDYDDPVLATGEMVGFQTGEFSTTIVGIDPTTESIEWTAEWITDDPERDIAVHDGVVYSGLEKFTAFDTASNSVLWAEHFDRESEQSMPVATDGEQVYFTGLDEEVLAVEAETGQLRWRQSVEGISRTVKPAVTDDALYVSTEDGFAALSPATGRELRRFSLYSGDLSERQANGQLLVAGGQVFYVDTATAVAYR